MYAERLRAYIASLARLTQVDATRIPLIDESLACYLAILAKSTSGTSSPDSDILQLSVRLTLLTRGLIGLDSGPDIEAIHYLVAMAYEQSGAVFGTTEPSNAPEDAITNEPWYRLLLATLHYLAGGYRVQAVSSRRAMQAVRGSNRTYDHGDALVRAAVEGSLAGLPDDRHLRILTEGHPFQREIIGGLLSVLRRRADVLLSHLGEGSLESWGQQRGLNAPGTAFWRRYLRRLRERGITSFTAEQGRFDEWLLLTRHLLVQLPTGAGKSIIGELLTALHIAAGKSVVWLLPTRALVRQVKRDLRNAFQGLPVEVEELPSTEDALPLFSEDAVSPRQISVTTPERLSALARSNPGALSSVTLVVFDEAHLLLDRNRGVTAEQVLRRIREILPQCLLALMTGLPEAREPLLKTMSALGAEPWPVLSELRPTRRIYGVVTDEPIGDRARTAVLVHPPLADVSDMREPYSIVFASRKRKASASKTDIASRLAAHVRDSGIRSAIFVNTKTSAESRARHLARSPASPQRTFVLPAGSKARLQLELGRMSVIEETAPRGVAPHHAGLAPLEQHFVERWVDEGNVRLVFATPTLAQGINLPFSLAVVTFLDRFNTITEEREALTPGEIMNMLGRAGRAGRVADGLCLLAIESVVADKRDLMRRSGQVFFAQPLSRDVIGMAALLVAGMGVIGAPEWPRELHGIRFMEAQTLVATALRFAAAGITTAAALRTEIDRYPSVGAVRAEWRNSFASDLETLIGNLLALLADKPLAREIAARSGLPPEFCLAVDEAVRNGSPNEERSAETWVEWTDAIVRKALESCVGRSWHRDVVGDYSLESLFVAVNAWRSGSPVAGIEMLFANEGERPRIGEFLNHDLGTLSQFWAAIPVAAELIGSSSALEGTRPIPTMVRDGVGSIDAIVWLRAVGGVDRVLAQWLSSVSPLDAAGYWKKLRLARRSLSGWRSRRSSLPAEHQTALEDLLAESE
jgi:hypothetical protein